MFGLEKGNKGVEIKKELRSLNGRRCLTKCYEKGHKFFHPISLIAVTSMEDGTCATDPYYDTNDMDSNILLMQDKCNIQDNATYIQPDESTTIFFSFNFDPDFFLSYFYSIKSFNDAINWTLENDHLPYWTIYRIHNCAWKVYGRDVNSLSIQVLEYYYEKTKSEWLIFYSDVFKKKISFNESTKETDTDSEQSNLEITKILQDMYTYKFFVTTIKKYIYENQDKWDKIQSHYNKIRIFILDNIKKHIKYN